MESILIMPASFIPAYSGACEYTCDRKAASQDGAAAKPVLRILSIGKVLYKNINEPEFLEEIHSESNIAVCLLNVLQHIRL